MFKRLLSLALALALLLPACGALAATPNPIRVLSDSEIPPTPEGIHHYMLMCLDAWNANPDNLGYTDGLMLLTLDTVNQRVMLTSFIRDMLILKPEGNKYGSINAVAKTYGVEETVNTLNRHFGLRIEKYIVMDWKQIERIVDSLGGVTLELTNAEASWFREASSVISPSNFSPRLSRGGTYTLTGRAALYFMRIRKNIIASEAGDLNRTERGRRVLTALAGQLSDVSLGDALNLVDVIGNNMRITNMTAADLLSAMNYAMGLKGLEVEQFRVPLDDTWENITVGSTASIQIDYEVNRKALHEYLYGEYTIQD